MEVFISWSGDRSKAAAKALRDWLPYVLQYVDPWMSDSDIEAGARWAAEIGTKLNSCKFGIICLTPENQRQPWIQFEAGALAKSVTERERVCPLMLGFESLSNTPLTQFQAKKNDRSGLLAIVRSINAASDSNRMLPEARLLSIFEKFWPDLEESFSSLPPGAADEDPPFSVEAATRETLENSRELLRRTDRPPAIVVTGDTRAAYQTLFRKVQRRLADFTDSSGTVNADEFARAFSKDVVPEDEPNEDK